MTYFLLQAAPQAAGGGMISSLVMLGLVFAIMYFLMIRPQQKKQKQMQEMLTKLKVHDTVVTSGGITGKIVAFKADKDLVVIRVDDQNGTKIDFQRSAVVGVISGEKEATQG
jgi:preprotein translocase subunit YajC